MTFNQIHTQKQVFRQTSYVGGVPKFWKQLREENPNAEEIIEDINQDGYGMGILYKN